MTPWQVIFMNSKANGAENNQEMLPVNRWEFPASTWLQSRLELVREERKGEG